jgi:hypothetical protein
MCACSLVELALITPTRCSANLNLHRCRAATPARCPHAAVTVTVYFSQGGDFNPATVFTAVSLLLVIRFPLIMLVRVRFRARLCCVESANC